MTQISLLGCGWLGLPLAKKLIAENFVVKGSTTSAEKVAILQDARIIPFQIELSEHQITGDIAEFLSGSKVLIIDIPPKLRIAQTENFVSKIANLIPFIEQSEIRNVIFISSTSVYGDSDLTIVDEETEPNAATESGKQLLQVEKLLKNSEIFLTTTLRFGGLVGDGRHPVYHLANRKNVENASAPINLIHQDDCIAILLAVIKQQRWDVTLNAVAPFHPTREQYYTQKALRLNLQPPVFEPESTSSGKIIQSEKLQKILDYRFIWVADI